MTGEGRAAAIASERSLADEELRVAEAVLAAGSPRVALTRVYYAAFHLTRALLFHSDIEPRTHDGVRRLFNLHWVAPGRAEPRWNALLARLQKYREEADYAVGFVVDEDWVRREITEVAALRAFVAVAVSRG